MAVHAEGGAWVAWFTDMHRTLPFVKPEKPRRPQGIKSSAYGDSHNGYYIGNTPAIDRLGIPSVNMQDASQGFRTIDKAMYGQVREIARLKVHRTSTSGGEG